MKKLAFTLAEILVTLGIVGVVAALTIPSLVSDTEGAKIGPKLGKAASTFEQANVALLAEEGVDSIYDAWGTNTADYVKALSRHMKTVSVSANELKTKDGFTYTMSTGLGDPEYIGDEDLMSVPSQEYIEEQLIISWGDGNISGKDKFFFMLYNDGSLRPFGGTGYNGSNTDHWSKKCPKAEDGDVDNYIFCAGHIFENNMKVLYK